MANFKSCLYFSDVNVIFSNRSFFTAEICVFSLRLQSWSKKIKSQNDKTFFFKTFLRTFSKGLFPITWNSIFLVVPVWLFFLLHGCMTNLQFAIWNYGFCMGTICIAILYSKQCKTVWHDYSDKVSSDLQNGEYLSKSSN